MQGREYARHETAGQHGLVDDNLQFIHVQDSNKSQWTARTYQNC